ncbi:unnamed protein product [Sphagnum troendelagicum]|uniref:Uncharacterized protein n=1 Tax=Sphagnum troendelagicum TaxID=128251 RepID=A0ABP0TF20_9BRYO
MGSEEILIADLERGAIGKVSAGSEEEYYVGLAGSPEAAAAAAACSEGGRTNRKVRRALRIASTVFVTIACLLVTLYLAGPTVKSFNGLLLSSTNLKLGDDVTGFEQPHRTSFHYQPAKNWMNGKLAIPISAQN